MLVNPPLVKKVLPDVVCAQRDMKASHQPCLALILFTTVSTAFNLEMYVEELFDWLQLTKQVINGNGKKLEAPWMD
jgi:hypothetical protein